METPQMKNRRVRLALADQLRAYLGGRIDVGDIIDFEADYGLDDEIDSELRRWLDLLSLLADEVYSGWAPTTEFDDLARKTLGELAPPTVSTEAAAD